MSVIFLDWETRGQLGRNNTSQALVKMQSLLCSFDLENTKSDLYGTTYPRFFTFLILWKSSYVIGSLIKLGVSLCRI